MYIELHPCPVAHTYNAKISRICKNCEIHCAKKTPVIWNRYMHVCQFFSFLNALFLSQMFLHSQALQAHQQNRSTTNQETEPMETTVETSQTMPNLLHPQQHQSTISEPLVSSVSRQGKFCSFPIKWKKSDIYIQYIHVYLSHFQIWLATVCIFCFV